ncbi:hypothetical protein Tco_0407489 [Tanacetum coccineum]
MTDSQSPKEGVRRVILEFRVMGPHPWSVASFPPGNGHPSTTLVSQIGNTSRTFDIKPNKRPRLKKKPYPSSLPEQIFASATQQMSQIRKRSYRKQNLSANRKGKYKSINRKKSEKVEQVRLGTIVRMIRGYTSRKRPCEQAEQWLDNEISFPSTPGIYVDGGSSSEVMYEHCFQNLRAETRAKLKESRTPLVRFSGEVSYLIGTINLNVTMGESERLQTIPIEFAVIKSHSPYNVILGRTSLRSLGDVASTIHSMIKFPTANGIATVTTKKETLHECRRMEEAQGPTLERRITFPRIPALGSEGTTNTGREEIQGQGPPSPPEKDT